MDRSSLFQASPRFPRPLIAFLLAVLSLLLGASAAFADPPGRIGRLAWLSGTATLQNRDGGESSTALVNQPLTSGDILTTDPGSRAEIQIGSKTIRLDSGTTLEFDRVDDQQVSLYLSNGRAIAKLSTRDAMRDFDLATRDGRFTPRETGIYRFDADNGSSSATTYYGRLQAESDSGTLDIRPDETAQFWNDGQPHNRLSSALNDDFTRWSVVRDQRQRPTTYARYVSPEMTGAEDLDAYGTWADTPEYGAVWYPRAVTSGWAPYRTGRWAWVAPWGWTWVDDEPWGFAPFHYGRWVRYRGAWGWVPGARVARPVFAPALVAWIGTPSAGVSVSIGTAPTVGWFPLAPHEVYVPGYRTSPQYVRNVNITHVTNITNINTIINEPQAAVRHMRYAHRETPHAVTMVPSEVLAQRRPVAAAAVTPRDQRAVRLQPVQAAAPIAPPAPERRGPPQRAERPERFARPGHQEPQATIEQGRGHPESARSPEAPRTAGDPVAAPGRGLPERSQEAARHDDPPSWRTGRNRPRDERANPETRLDTRPDRSDQRQPNPAAGMASTPAPATVTTTQPPPRPERKESPLPSQEPRQDHLRRDSEGAVGNRPNMRPEPTARESPVAPQTRDAPRSFERERSPQAQPRQENQRPERMQSSPEQDRRSFDLRTRERPEARERDSGRAVVPQHNAEIRREAPPPPRLAAPPAQSPPTAAPAPAPIRDHGNANVLAPRAEPPRQARPEHGERRDAKGGQDERQKP